MTMLAKDRYAADDSWLPQKQLTAATARSMLQSWQSDGAKLDFGYFRSGGGVMQTGSAKVLRVAPGLLTLDTEGSRIAVGTKDARFEFGNLGLLTPDFRAVHDVEGLSIILGNHDWVCLSADTGEGDLLSLAQKLSSLP